MSDDASMTTSSCVTCSSPAVVVFDAEDFQFAGIGVIESVTGGWPACDTCAPLVRSRSWAALATRAVSRSIQSAATPRWTSIDRMFTATTLTSYFTGVFEQLDKALTGTESPIAEEGGTL